LNPPKDFPPIKSVVTIDGLRIIFEDGWALVRASNTTPVLVTRFEASSPQAAKRYQEAVMDLLNRIKDEL